MPSTSPPGDLYSERRFSGEFFCVTILGGLYLKGLTHGGVYFRNFMVLHEKLQLFGVTLCKTLTYLFHSFSISTP